MYELYGKYVPNWLCGIHDLIRIIPQPPPQVGCFQHAGSIINVACGITQSQGFNLQFLREPYGKVICRGV